MSLGQKCPGGGDNTHSHCSPRQGDVPILLVERRRFANDRVVRDVFLILRRDVARRDGAPTVRTRGRQPGVVRLVHTPRAGTMGPATIRGARAPTRTPARPLTAGLRTRRRLPIPRAARGVELLLQPITLALQAIALACDIAARALGARECLAQPRPRRAAKSEAAA